jgi:hypothetical protein
MKNNTTGHSMEVFYIVLLKLSLLCHYILYRHIKNISVLNDGIVSSLKKNHDSIQVLIGDLHDEILAISYGNQIVKEKIDQLSSQQCKPTDTPIKPNNWDNVRKAFTRPVRIVVDE